VRLGLAADGFNPFNNLSQAYSMWLVILTTYNMPPWPLIKDLKVLWDRKGVETIDVASDDFPARSSLSEWSGQGYKACPSTLLLRSLEFNGQTDNTDPPKEFGRDVILAQLDRLPMHVKGKHPSHGGVKIKCNVHVRT
ncbi:hypothetical protein Tco_0186567, partial [Tanacetum coccineum]